MVTRPFRNLALLLLLLPCSCGRVRPTGESALLVAGGDLGAPADQGPSTLRTALDDGATVVVTSAGAGSTFVSSTIDVPSNSPLIRIVADSAARTRTLTQYDEHGAVTGSAIDVVDSAQIDSAQKVHDGALPFAEAALLLRKPRPNEAGCDYLHAFDCTGRGACCDAHDVAIGFPMNQPPCPGSCGNLVYATLHPNECLRNNPACSNAHGTVINCFLSHPGPGPSACCARGDCRRPQCGLQKGPPPVVLTRPQECAMPPPPPPADLGAPDMHATQP